jgi:hypothetical protein
MTVGLNPQRTCHDEPLLIHAQTLHGRSPCRRQALHPSRVLDPSEVIPPLLPAWMKQGHCCARYRIQSRDGRGFAEVTGGTGQAQIRKIIAAVGIDVLYMHRLANGVPTGLTVFAAIPRLFVDQAHEGGPGYVTHPLRNPQWTASRRLPDIPARSARQRPGLSAR